MEDNEIEELNPLQTFLLVLVKFGLSTPYDLLSNVGLGPGLTSPALKRLEEAGLLTSTPGPRKRLRYAITKQGRNRLDRNLKSRKSSYWRLGQADAFESLPRGMILAWLHAGIEEAERGAERAAENLANLSLKRRLEGDELHRSMIRLQSDILKNDPDADEGMLIATTYQWLKALCDAEMYSGQAKAIGQIIRSLADFPPAPQLR
jgi:DNA-binding PadR family transcriptional regulator